MGIDEQDAMLGRTLRERQQAREALKYLNKKAKDLGEGLAAIGAGLQSGTLLDSVDTQGGETTRLQVKKEGRQAGVDIYAYPDVIVLFEIIRERRELEKVIREATDILRSYES